MDRLALAQEVLKGQAFSRLLGTELIAWEADGVTLALNIDERLTQQRGFVHGGVLAYLADNALTFAGGAALGPHVITGEFKINYLRPGLGQRLIAHATVVHAGRNQAVCRCEIRVRSGAEEKLCACAQGTIVRFGQTTTE